MENTKIVKVLDFNFPAKNIGAIGEVRTYHFPTKFKLCFDFIYFAPSGAKVLRIETLALKEVPKDVEAIKIIEEQGRSLHRRFLGLVNSDDMDRQLCSFDEKYQEIIEDTDVIITLVEVTGDSSLNILL